MRAHGADETLRGMETMTSRLAGELRDHGFTGRLEEPGHVGYDLARQNFNGAIDRYPAAIAFARDAEDVGAAIRGARAIGLPITVRGGGHSIAGRSIRDGALCIDLRALNRIDVDPGTGIVRVGGGALLSELDAATQEHGLAVPAGQISHTGVGGLALGGGLGWLMRHHGLTVDALTGAEVVLADGRVVEAADEPELLWALRGGGGEFGVVTAFEFQAVRVGTVLGGLLVFPWERAREAFETARSVMAGAPEELTSFVVLITAPPELGGGRAAVIAVAWSGDLAEGERVIAPLRVERRARPRGADALHGAAVDARPHGAARVALPRQDALPARGRRRVRRRAAGRLRGGARRRSAT